MNRIRRTVTTALATKSPDYANININHYNSNTTSITDANGSFDPSAQATLLLRSSNLEFRANLNKFLMEKAISGGNIGISKTQRKRQLVKNALVKLAQELVLQTKANCLRPRVEYVIEQSWIKSMAAASIEGIRRKEDSNSGLPCSIHTDGLVSVSLHDFNCSNRVLYLVQALYRLGYDLEEDLLVDLLDSSVCYFTRPEYPTSAAYTVASSFPSLLASFDLENELAKCIHRRDYYLLKCIQDTELFLESIECAYTPQMISKLIEAYLSVGEWNIAFSRLLDAKNAGLVSAPDELTKIYSMIFKKCQYEKSPSIYIAGDLRYDLEREGIPIQGSLGSALLQCCITSGDYAACAEVARALSRDSLSSSSFSLHSLLSSSGKSGGFFP